MESLGNDQLQDKKKADLRKTRLLLEEPLDSPLNQFQMELKSRGVKDINLNELVTEALEQVPQKWWDEKVEALTPLDYKVQAALKNPDLRQKFISLLEQEGSVH